MSDLNQKSPKNHQNSSKKFTTNSISSNSILVRKDLSNQTPHTKPEFIAQIQPKMPLKVLIFSALLLSGIIVLANFTVQFQILGTPLTFGALTYPFSFLVLVATILYQINKTIGYIFFELFAIVSLYIVMGVIVISNNKKWKNNNIEYLKEYESNHINEYIKRLDELNIKLNLNNKDKEIIDDGNDISDDSQECKKEYER